MHDNMLYDGLTKFSSPRSIYIVNRGIFQTTRQCTRVCLDILRFFLQRIFVLGITLYLCIEDNRRNYKMGYYIGTRLPYNNSVEKENQLSFSHD